MTEDHELVQRLREGDESAFVELIDRYGATMLRVAQMYVRDRATAEEVVQETWLAVLNGIDRFEGRSSLKTWLFRILTNRAKTRGERDGRVLPFSALAGAMRRTSPPSTPTAFSDLTRCVQERGPLPRAPGLRTSSSSGRRST
jgi:RNA polymerase sigma-70 factor, ECF subfamily